MGERIPSDHDGVPTHRVRIREVGRSGRPALELPAGVGGDAGDVFWLALSGQPAHARVERTLDDDRVVKFVADNARLARRGEGTNRLVEWVDAADVALGGTVHLDVVTDGFAYGVREPGSRVVYDAPEPPDESLAAIAEHLES